MERTTSFSCLSALCRNTELWCDEANTWIKKKKPCLMQRSVSWCQLLSVKFLYHSTAILRFCICSTANLQKEQPVHFQVTEGNLQILCLLKMITHGSRYLWFMSSGQAGLISIMLMLIAVFLRLSREKAVGQSLRWSVIRWPSTTRAGF